MKKVRVTFKNPIKEKTATMFMTEEAIKFNRRSAFSPYKKVAVLK